MTTVFFLQSIECVTLIREVAKLESFALKNSQIFVRFAFGIFYWSSAHSFCYGPAHNRCTSKLFGSASTTKLNRKQLIVMFLFNTSSTASVCTNPNWSSQWWATPSRSGGVVTGDSWKNSTWPPINCTGTTLFRIFPWDFICCSCFSIQLKACWWLFVKAFHPTEREKYSNHVRIMTNK